MKQRAKLVMLILVVEFNCNDAEMELMRVALFLKFSKISNVVFGDFPNFLLSQQQFQLFCMLSVYMVNVLIKLFNSALHQILGLCMPHAAPSAMLRGWGTRRRCQALLD